MHTCKWSLFTTPLTAFNTDHLKPLGKELLRTTQNPFLQMLKEMFHWDWPVLVKVECDVRGRWVVVVVHVLDKCVGHNLATEKTNKNTMSMAATNTKITINEAYVGKKSDRMNVDQEGANGVKKITSVNVHPNCRPFAHLSICCFFCVTLSFTHE